jgi:hypothetical protein
MRVTRVKKKCGVKQGLDKAITRAKDLLSACEQQANSLRSIIQHLEGLKDSSGPSPSNGGAGNA